MLGDLSSKPYDVIVPGATIGGFNGNNYAIKSIRRSYSATVGFIQHVTASATSTASVYS